MSSDTKQGLRFLRRPSLKRVQGLTDNRAASPGRKGCLTQQSKQLNTGLSGISPFCQSTEE